VKQEGWRRIVKISFDRAVAGAGLVALGGVIGATALAIRATMGSPVLFRQTRPGFGGRPFTILKFRTMREFRPAVGGGGTMSDQLRTDGQRLTPLGRFLRSTSLDELPQLWNVVRGDISLVGPRPLLMEYLPRYSAEQSRRHDVLPGLTGWAQVEGRNALSWDDKFAADVWYVDHWSLGLDLRILARTAFKVVKREGIIPTGHERVPEFMGSEPKRGDAA
jgi:lipopolysaccharide/colanic/teichoic acid biosynthesis glycosyltransferase